MRERLVSLDAFRGITIAGMILVNNPGSWSHVYSPLLHAKWHGWTPTDFIFPFKRETKNAPIIMINAGEMLSLIII